MRVAIHILALSALALASLAAQSIDGLVTNASTGGPIPGARVRIFPADHSGDARTVNTDSNGRFHLESLPAGAYRARFAAPGFQPSPDGGDDPKSFLVHPGTEPVRLEAKLQPLGVISGHVIDAGGKPVAGASLWLAAQEKWCMPPDCFPDHRLAKTGADGEFRFTDLNSGPWLVSAAAPPDWTQTFYPGATDPDLAQPVILRTGAEQSSVEIKLAAAEAHRIRGRILDAQGNAVAGASAVLSKRLGPALATETGPDGAFEFPAVPDGEWRLWAAADRETLKLQAIQMLQLRKQDLENVELRLAAPFSLHGKIVLQSPEGMPAPEPPPIGIVLQSTTSTLSDRAQAFHIVRVEGPDLSVDNVYPGTYLVQVLTDAPAPYYLDSIRLGEQNAAGPVSIYSAFQPLAVTLRLGGGMVRGTIDGCTGGRVFLVPRESALRRGGFIRIAPCDTNGRFEFSAVRPGDYYGLATMVDPRGRSFAQLADDRVLTNAATLSVRANETTAPDLHLTVW